MGSPILVDLVALAPWRDPAVNHEPAPDAGDDHLWDLLACFDQAILVTGDGLLQRQPPSFASVVTPREFLALRDGEARDFDAPA